MVIYVMYDLRMFIVVLQELHCLPIMYSLFRRGYRYIYQFTKFHLLLNYVSPVLGYMS